MELSRPGHGARPADRGPTRPCARSLRLKKKDLSSYRPTGRLDPAPAALAYGSLALAALESRARRGEIIVLSEDATILWRFALPRAGWWRTAQRARLWTRPRSPGQSKQAESRKRQTGLPYRAWSRITSGVRRSVIGAVPYGPAKVFSTIVPHCAAQELRQYRHQVMAIFGKTGKEVVMVVDRSGMHRAPKLDATREHDHNKLRCHCLPAHGGHHLNPSEGFWRVMKDAIGAGRCFGDLQQLYWRTRQVLIAHQERPLYAFHW
jgi:DDE superfamily endonuclease